MKWGFDSVVQGRLNRERLAKGHTALIAATSEDFDPDPVVMDSAIPSSVSASALVNERGRVQEVSRESSSTCAIAILTLLPAFAIVADVYPPAQSPETGSGPAPSITPEKPSESGVLAIPPYHMDTGIQHTPERRADPRGSVQPPRLDPSMSTNPDVAPSPREGINPPGGTRPQGNPRAP